MAKPKTIPSATAVKVIDTPKFWLPNSEFAWAQTSVKKFPSSYKLRLGLEVETSGGRIEPEGLFIECFFKKSFIDLIPDTLYMSLLVQNARVFGIDENGPGGHINRVGLGMPFYQQQVNHPHMHIPADESSYGYAEPISRQPIKELWNLFLKQANIYEAPSIILPGETNLSTQMDLL